jgi:biotin carboxyl carrier protein
MRYEIEAGGRNRQIVVHRADGAFRVMLDGREALVDAVRLDGDTWSLLIDGASYEVSVAARPGGSFAVAVGTTQVVASLNAGRRRAGNDAAGSGAGPERITAPMPGRIVRVLARPGDVVRARQPLIVIEAMKMENELRAGRDGRVVEMHAVEGQSVDPGALLAVLSAAD